jgi:hypothetical protein
LGFFDDIALRRAESAVRPQPRPDGVLATPVPVRLVLAHTGQAAIAVTGLQAFPTGFDLRISVELRTAVPGLGDASFLGALDGQPADDEFLRLGIQFSTGEKAANTELSATRDVSVPAGPIMKLRIAGAGALSRDWLYWVSPLPPAGPLAFVCEWPALAVAESRSEIDGQLLLDAAADSITLWP